jgi:hypothetical protein
MCLFTLAGEACITYSVCFSHMKMLVDRKYSFDWNNQFSMENIVQDTQDSN